MTENKKTYNLYLSSNDKISGTHNNPTFNVNWDTFLPRNKYFSVNFSFVSCAGQYADCTITPLNQTLYNSAIKINCNLQDTHFSSDTSSQSTTMNLGYASIDCAYVISYTKGNSYLANYLSNPSKVIIRPQNSQLTFWIYNLSALSNNITFPASTAGFNPAN